MNAIVIGGGPAGLIAANLLADRGLAVTLLERRAALGGRAAGAVQDGVVLNQGPHALYLGGPAQRTLERLGIPIGGRRPAVRGPVVVRDGRPVPALRMPGKIALARVLARPAPAHVSAAEWLGDDGLAAALTRVATYAGDLHALSADAARMQLRRATWPGVRYLHGGWQAMVDALAERARRRGVTIRTGVKVEAIEPGWTVDGESADAVVVASGTPQRAQRLLAGALDTSHWRVGPAALAASLDLALEALPRRRPTFATSVDAPRYFSVHSPPARLGGVLVTAAAYEGVEREELEAFADLVQPGWRERARFTRFLPAMTAVSALPTPAHGGLAGRVGAELAPGLAVAGDWVGPDGLLLDAAAASAVQAATLVARARARVPA
jgi:phytoene dehydrogenase-like protein